MGAIKKIAVAVLALAVIGFLGAMDYSDALIQEAIEKEQRPMRAMAANEVLPLGFPLDFDAIVCQAGKCRYYSRSKSK